MPFILYKSNWGQSKVYAQMIKTFTPNTLNVVKSAFMRYWQRWDTVCLHQAAMASKRVTVIIFFFLFLGQSSTKVVNVIHPKRSAVLFAADSPRCCYWQTPWCWQLKRVMLFSVNHSPLSVFFFFFLFGLVSHLFLKCYTVNMLILWSIVG